MGGASAGQVCSAERWNAGMMDEECDLHGCPAFGRRWMWTRQRTGNPKIPSPVPRQIGAIHRRALISNETEGSSHFPGDTQCGNRTLRVWTKFAASCCSTVRSTGLLPQHCGQVTAGFNLSPPPGYVEPPALICPGRGTHDRTPR
jgi:hypothetical protein